MPKWVILAPMQRIPSLPPLHVLPRTLSASCYNRVRLALRRLGKPLRVELDAVGQAAMVLDDRGWLCVDTGDGDQPLFLLTDFDVRNRSALHAPVHCRIRLYHAHAGLLITNVLKALEATLDERLAIRR